MWGALYRFLAVKAATGNSCKVAVVDFYAGQFESGKLVNNFEAACISAKPIYAFYCYRYKEVCG